MRKLFVVFIGAAIAVGALVLAVPAGAAGPPLSDYVIYGENGVVIGNGTTVTGLVGAKNPVPGTTTALTLQGGSSIVSNAPDAIGDARSGGNIRMLNQTSIQGTLTHPAGTTLTKSATSTVGAEVIGDPQLPASLPPKTNVTCPTGKPADNGGNNATRTYSLPANATNGAVSLGGTVTLNFTSAGTYVFDSIHAGNGVTLNVVPGVKIVTCGDVSFGGNVVVNGVTSANDFSVEAQSTDNHNAFKIGGGVTWIGNVYTPLGGIHIGSGGSNGTITGSLVAGQQVDLEHSLVVNGPGGGHINRPVADKDATMEHAAKNENNGANNSIQVHYQEDSVIGFDVTQNTFPAPRKALIVLTVCNTPGDLNFCPEAPSGWPANGGTDTAMRLNDGWERWGSGFPNPTNTPAEGNGNNFPIKNNPRGNGQGVTWNCAIDNEIANEAQDCSNANGNFWNAGLNFDHGAVNNTPPITNNMADGTKITFDVTALYNEGMGPKDTTFMSFFIRKVQNSGSGFVAYYSIQGAAAKGDPSLAPQLVIS